MVIVAIVGPDGCGKTTQSEMLVDRLKRNSYEAMYVRPIYILMNLIRFVGGCENSVSPRIARVTQNSNKKSSTIKRPLSGLLGYPYAIITYLFMKIRYRNKIVVCDRYYYQFFYDLFGDLSEKVIGIFPRPNIAFFLDGDLDLFYSRMDESFDATVSRDYYIGVLNLYRRVSKKYGFIRIDANLSKEAINDIMLLSLKNMRRTVYEEE